MIDNILYCDFCCYCYKCKQESSKVIHFTYNSSYQEMYKYCLKCYITQSSYFENSDIHISESEYRKYFILI